MNFHLNYVIHKKLKNTHNNNIVRDICLEPIKEFKLTNLHNYVKQRIIIDNFIYNHYTQVSSHNKNIYKPKNREQYIDMFPNKLNSLELNKQEIFGATENPSTSMLYNSIKKYDIFDLAIFCKLLNETETMIKYNIKSDFIKIYDKDHQINDDGLGSKLIIRRNFIFADNNSDYRTKEMNDYYEEITSANIFVMEQYYNNERNNASNIFIKFMDSCDLIKAYYEEVKDEYKK